MKGLRVGLIYGFAGLLFSFLWLCAEYWLGFHSHRIGWYQFVSVINNMIIFLLVVLCMNKMRRASAGTNFTFWLAFQAPMIAVLILSLGCMATQSLFYSYINPEFFKLMPKHYIAEGMSVEDAARYFERTNFMGREALKNFVIGLVMTLFWAGGARGELGADNS